MSGPKHPQGRNISDPHNLAATFYLRGLLNTSILRSTPNNISYPVGSLPLWASSISAVVYVLHREKPSWGIHSICGPWPRNFNLVTVEQGTFHHSSTLPAISMDFQKKKNKKQINWHHLSDRPAMTSQRGGATGHRPASRQRPPNPSSTVSSKYHIHQFVSIRPLAFPNNQLYNLLPFDTCPRNGDPVQPTPQGEHDQTKWRSAKSN